MSIVVRTNRDGVTTLRMNRPDKLNGWTLSMMEALGERMAGAAVDGATKVLVLTGTDPYYSAGVNLAGTLSLGHPRRLRDDIARFNKAIFDRFIDFPKPILVAVNGPAIGAVVTSAALCDRILASDKATFSTPFARLGVTPEGCSSVLFPKLLGPDAATRMLEEGWAPTAEEACEAGLVDRVVPHDTLLDEAHAVALRWIEEGRERTFRGGMTASELHAINARESEALADAFLAEPFLKGQYAFLRKKNKRVPALMFWALWRSRPLWARLL